MASMATITLSMVETAAVLGTTKARVSQLLNEKKLHADKVLDAEQMRISWRVHVDSIRKRIAWLAEQNYTTTEAAQASLARLDEHLGR